MTPEEIQAKIDAEVAGLKAKNNELLGKLKEFDKFKGVDVDQLRKDAEALRELQKKADEESGNYKKLYGELQQATAAQIEAAKKEAEEAKKAVTDFKKRSALNAALNEVKVIPALADFAIGTLIADADMVDGTLVIKGKPAVDFVKEWSATEVGKHFVASGNSGGGERGGTAGGGNEARFFDKKSPDYNLTEQAKIAKNNPELYNRLKK